MSQFRHFVIALLAGNLGLLHLPAKSAGATSCAIYSAGRCTYSATKAVEYATDQVFKTAPASSTDAEHWNRYFVDYTSYGGNCTNFVSQALLGGLVGSRYPSKVYPNAQYFATDYLNSSQRIWAYGYTKWGYVGAAWRDANSFYAYAKNSQPTNRGIHFTFISKDSSNTPLAFSAIRVGDVVFADWTSDGNIDHTMIVTGKTANSYAGTLVTYQNSVGYSPQKNRPLSAFNSTKITFHVYRPTYYTDIGY